VLKTLSLVRKSRFVKRISRCGGLDKKIRISIIFIGSFSALPRGRGALDSRGKKPPALDFPKGGVYNGNTLRVRSIYVQGVTSMGDRRSKPERRHFKRSAEAKIRRVSDRRRKKRYQVRQGAFAALVNGSQRLGQIKDISLVGLSFRYIDSREKPGTKGVLKILLAGEGLFLDNLPFKPVRDVAIENSSPFSTVKMRQMHVAFGDLGPRELSLLDEFILNHTMGEA
jgi:hypothetical protein